MLTVNVIGVRFIQRNPLNLPILSQGTPTSGNGLKTHQRPTQTQQTIATTTVVVQSQSWLYAARSWRYNDGNTVNWHHLHRKRWSCRWLRQLGCLYLGVGGWSISQD